MRYNRRAVAGRAARRAAAALVALTELAACGGSADRAADRVADRAQDGATAHVADHLAGRAHPAGAEAADAARGDTVTVTVYKSPTCGCCAKWADHMRANGFRVVVHDTADVESVRRDHGVTGLLASCHTAVVGGYVVEGHVPAADVWRLLRERPALAGIAVPGMPMGAPGMEGPYPADRFQVFAFDRDGGGGVYAPH